MFPHIIGHEEHFLGYECVLESMNKRLWSGRCGPDRPQEIKFHDSQPPKVHKTRVNTVCINFKFCFLSSFH